jgi:hypothetical protein
MSLLELTKVILCYLLITDFEERPKGFYLFNIIT